MVRGYETLSEIDARIRELRNEAAHLDGRIDKLVGTLQRLEEQQTRIVKQIAQVQWNAIASGAIDASDFSLRLHDAMQRRNQAYVSLQNKIAQAQVQLEELETKRNEAYERLQKASQAVTAKEHEVQAALENDGDYQTLLSQVRDAKQTLANAEQKANEADAYYTQKAKVFENDPLFAYLWTRNYATSEYRANPLTAYLDGKIAEWIDYRDYVPIYRKLKAVPHYLREQSQARQQAFDEALCRLQAYERSKAHEEGLEAIQDEEKKRREALDAIDDRIDELEQDLAQLTERKQRYLIGEDEEGRALKALLNEYLHDSDLLTLMERAMQTASQRDDALVRELETVRNEYGTTQQALQEARKRYDELRDRLEEFASLRRRFKRSRYDDYRSGFGTDASQIGEVLGGLLGGLLQSDAVWDTLRRTHRTIETGSWPDFGSGGIDPQGSPWSFPMPREGGDSFGFPDTSGGFSSRNPLGSDTFRTGGGF